MRPVFSRRGFASSPGAGSGSNVGNLRSGLVANRFIFGDVVLRQDAQVHHQSIYFFVDSELSSCHILISL